MNDPNDKELSALFARDCSELADEAFVRHCVTSIRRAERRLLVLKLIAVGGILGIASLISPPLADLGANVSITLADALAALDGRIGGIDRAVAIAIVLALLIRRYGLPAG